MGLSCLFVSFLNKQRNKKKKNGGQGHCLPLFFCLYRRQPGTTATVSPSRKKSRFAYSLRSQGQCPPLGKGQAFLLPIIKDRGFLSSLFLSCNATQRVSRCPLAFSTACCGNWGSGNWYKNADILLLLLLQVINYLLSLTQQFACFYQNSWNCGRQIGGSNFRPFRVLGRLQRMMCSTHLTTNTGKQLFVCLFVCFGRSRNVNTVQNYH